MEKWKKVRWLLLAGLFLCLLVGGGILYRSLAEKYEPEAPSIPEVADELLPDASDFTVYHADGDAFRLADFVGRPVLVNFWATWCPPCRNELPAFQAAYEEYGEDITFMMVDLTDGTRETQEIVDEFLIETGYTFPVYFDLDGSAAKAYQLYSIPETVGVNAEGKVIFLQVGALTEETLQDVIEDLLS